MKLLFLGAALLFTAACSRAGSSHPVFADQGEEIAWIEVSVVGSGEDTRPDSSEGGTLWTASISDTTIVEKREVAELDGDEVRPSGIYYMASAGYVLVKNAYPAGSGPLRIGVDGARSALKVPEGVDHVFPSRDGKFIAAILPDTMRRTTVGFTDVATNEVVALVDYPVRFMQLSFWDDQGRFWVHGTEENDPVEDPSTMEPDLPAKVSFSASPASPSAVPADDPDCYFAPTSSSDLHMDGRIISLHLGQDEPLIRKGGPPPCLLE